MGSIIPSQAELDRRKIVGVNRETVTNIASTDFPGHWPGEDHAWTLDSFKRAFRVQIHQNDPLESTFSLISIDASLANAFRRILLADMPTLAIDTVYVHNNTSLLADEVLAHRLGLIPLKGNSEAIGQMDWFEKPDPETGEGGSVPNITNTVVLNLAVKCTRNESAISQGETDPREKYNNAHVYAGQITCVPQDAQAEYFSGDDAIQPVNPDILITKLRPGQEIEMDLHCHIGTGAMHAKFSPVATATYRLLPTIDIKKPILGADARKFQQCFPDGVIVLQKVTRAEARKPGSGYEGYEGEDKAVVWDTFGDTVTRECLRHDEFKDKVKLGRIRDHFIFSVESTGQQRSDKLFLDSVRLLRAKAERLREDLRRISS